MLPAWEQVGDKDLIAERRRVGDCELRVWIRAGLSWTWEVKHDDGRHRLGRDAITRDSARQSALRCADIFNVKPAVKEPHEDPAHVFFKSLPGKSLDELIALWRAMPSRNRRHVLDVFETFSAIATGEDRAGLRLAYHIVEAL